MPRIITDSFSYRVSFELCGRGTLSYCLLCPLCDSRKIGGHGKTVQINESELVKRNCYCGHRVQGQWLFGVTDQDSGKCYILTAEYHSETTVKEWTVLGNVVISNCWKSYVHVKKHGNTINHSNEFVKRWTKLNDSGSEDRMGEICVLRTYCGIYVAFFT